MGYVRVLHFSRVFRLIRFPVHGRELTSLDKFQTEGFVDRYIIDWGFNDACTFQGRIGKPQDGMESYVSEFVIMIDCCHF